MSESRAQLWTIARSDFVERARVAGRARMSWDAVEPRWLPAYRWMLDQMRQRGLLDPNDLTDAPPVWAWHSCGGWQRPPGAQTVDMLFGSEPANRQGLCLVTWSAPVERLLLSYYAAWCELLDRVVAGGRPEDVQGTVLCPPLTRAADPPPWWAPGDDLQACVQALDWRDVTSISALPGMATK